MDVHVARGLARLMKEYENMCLNCGPTFGCTPACVAEGRSLLPAFSHDNHTPDEPCDTNCSGWHDTHLRNAEKAESVDHPGHYGGDTVYEAIKVIEAWDLGFSLGNAVKYISRAGKKDKAKVVEDLKKAVWYLNREITKLEG